MDCQTWTSMAVSRRHRPGYGYGYGYGYGHGHGLPSALLHRRAARLQNAATLPSGS